MVKTCYFVRSIHRVDGRLIAGGVRRFGFKPEALAAAEALAAYDAGVFAFEMDGDPLLDLWEEPRLLVAYGAAVRLTQEPALSAA